MRKLIQGIVDFGKQLTDEQRALYRELSHSQKPEALLISCSDSRVVPNFFASLDPGDLFVLRNVGNLFPPASTPNDSTTAALEYAILVLKIPDIVVCGHSNCGAMHAVANQTDTPPHLASWLRHAAPALPDADLLSQANVIQQLDNIATYPLVQEHNTRLHGLWFDIAHAAVHYYEPTLNRFVLIDEQEAEQILKRLG